MYKEIYNKINTIGVNNFVLFQKQEILVKLNENLKEEITKRILRRFRGDFIKYLIEDRKLMKVIRLVKVV